MSCGDTVKVSFGVVSMFVTIQNTGTSTVSYTIEKASGLSTGAIVGIAVGSVVGVLGIGAAIYFIRKRKLQSQLSNDRLIA